MNLRDFLEQRERDLQNELLALYTQITPKEAELAEIRRAMAAVGMPAAAPIKIDRGASEVVSSDRGEAPFQIPRIPTPAEIGSAIAKAHQVSPEILAYVASGWKVTASPWANLTMKQLVLKALEQHFQHGATTRKLLDFFRDAWGRDIERTNLSPQLSRLYQEGKIGRAPPLKEWHLMERSGIIVGYKGFVQRHNKEVVYMLSEQARPDEHIPILTTNDPMPDPNED